MLKPDVAEVDSSTPVRAVMTMAAVKLLPATVKDCAAPATPVVVAPRLSDSGVALIAGTAVVMVRVAVVLVTATAWASVTTTRYLVVLPTVVNPLMLKVDVVAPLTPVPLPRLLNVLPLFVEICH